MANSVGRFYSATLGSTQFEPDGEHTLFTTNSTTTRIIKEIKFFILEAKSRKKSGEGLKKFKMIEFNIYFACYFK